MQVNITLNLNLMKRTFIKLIIPAITLLIVISCSTVMITGRKQFLLFSQGEITSLSDASYKEISATSKVSANKTYVNMVSKVGLNLTKAVENYVKKNSLTGALEGINWKFDVFENEQINAFCLPNGNIVFYSGIMKYANTPDFIAVVMGHEIAHTLAKHGNERMSQEAVTGAVGQALANMIGTQSEKNKALFEVAFGLGSNLGVLLPYSRKHEYEADKLGLIIMAMAGYNINAAPEFWQKMASTGSNIEFLSTHPSDENRIAQIKKALPEAAKYAAAK